MGKEEITYHEDVEVSDPGPGEVKVRIHAAGVCHSDLSAMNGTLPQPAPAVLGHEGAGEIVAVGEGVPTINVGDHVIIAWTPPCGVCNPCLRGEANLCISIFFQIAGSQRFTVGGEPTFGFAGTGTFVEEMVVPYQGVVKIPDDVPYEIGALIGCGVTTGVGAALNTAKVKPGSTVAVFGAGGVGIAAIQGARIAGAAEIVAVDTVPASSRTRSGSAPPTAPIPTGSTLSTCRSTRGRDSTTPSSASGSPRRSGLHTTPSGAVGRRSSSERVANEAKVEFNAFELFFMEKKLLGSYYGSADVRT